MVCPICQIGDLLFFNANEGLPFYQCDFCDAIFSKEEYNIMFG